MAKQTAYALPSQAIVNLVDDAFKPPAMTLSPNRNYLVFQGLPPLKSIQEVASEELKVAGLRFSPYFCPSLARITFYSSLNLLKMPVTNERLQSTPNTLYDQTKALVPENTAKREKLGYVRWNAASDLLSFCKLHAEDEVTAKGVAPGLHLYVTNPESGKIFGPVDVGKSFPLSAVFGSAYYWLNDRQMIVKVACNAGIAKPEEDVIPKGPEVMAHMTKDKTQARTYQDLIQSDYDEEIFNYYATSELRLVTFSLNKKEISWKVTPFASLKPALFQGVNVSPSKEYVMISKYGQDLSRIVPYRRFEKFVDVYAVEGGSLNHVCEIAHLEKAENVPIVHDACRVGRRFSFWSEGHDHMVMCFEAVDDGDPRKESKHRDRIFFLSADSGFKKELEVVRTEMRANGLDMFEGGTRALLTEGSWKTKRRVRWLLTLDPSTWQMTKKEIMFDYSSEDRYAAPGSFSYARSSLGTLCPLLLNEGSMLLNNTVGATKEGNVPYVDLLQTKESKPGALQKASLKLGSSTRLWTSDHAAKKYQRIASVFPEDPSSCQHGLDFIRVIVATEQTDVPTNYFLCDLELSQEPAQGAVLKGWYPLTNFAHPYPSIKGYTKEIIQYKRDDGVNLSATLYCPPGFKPSKSKEDRYPLLLWAYPREFKSKDSAGQIRDSPYRFSRIYPLSPLLWLAADFVVLEGPAMPIVADGEDSRTANDTFVKQLVASAKAAVDHVCVDLKLCDPAKVAIGGHSYGAFMTANLLIHSPETFACGIARSGAYNRTWTPFGFQQEERTLWEVPNVYIDMSPFMNVHDKINPILLIHGMEDENSGTYPEQSKRMYSALKGNGVVSKLCLLPKEGHGYRARESILHCLAETEEWLRKYCLDKAAGSNL